MAKKQREIPVYMRVGDATEEHLVFTITDIDAAQTRHGLMSALIQVGEEIAKTLTEIKSTEK